MGFNGQFIKYVCIRKRTIKAHRIVNQDKMIPCKCPWFAIKQDLIISVNQQIAENSSKQRQKYILETQVCNKMIKINSNTINSSMKTEKCACLGLSGQHMRKQT